MEVLVLLPVEVRRQLGERAEPFLAHRERFLRELPRRDVGVGAARARRAPPGIARGHLAAGADPEPGAIVGPDPEFGIEAFRGALQCLDGRLLHALDIVGVDQREHLRDRAARLRGSGAEHCPPVGVEPDAVRGDVPVPDRERRALQGETDAFALVREVRAGPLHGRLAAPKHDERESHQGCRDRQDGEEECVDEVDREAGHVALSRRTRYGEALAAGGRRGDRRPRGRRGPRPPRARRRFARPRGSRTGPRSP